MQIRCADNTVSVLARYRAFVLRDEFVNFWSQFHDCFSVCRICEIHERDDVEICVADVSRDRVHDVVLPEKGI